MRKHNLPNLPGRKPLVGGRRDQVLAGGRGRRQPLHRTVPEAAAAQEWAQHRPADNKGMNHHTTLQFSA